VTTTRSSGRHPSGDSGDEPAVIPACGIDLLTGEKATSSVDVSAGSAAIIREEEG